MKIALYVAQYFILHIYKFANRSKIASDRPTDVGGGKEQSGVCKVKLLGVVIHTM